MFSQLLSWVFPNPPTHQEFGFWLHTCNLGNRVRTVINPFTKKPVELPVDDGLTPAECDALEALLNRADFVKSDIPGEGYALRLPQNTRVQLLGEIRPNTTGFAVEVVAVSLSEYLLDLILKIAQAGNLAFTSMTGELTCLLSLSDNTIVRQRWPDARIVRTSDDLKDWIENVIKGRPVRILKN